MYTRKKKKQYKEKKQKINLNLTFLASGCVKFLALVHNDRNKVLFLKRSIGMFHPYYHG